MLHLSEPQFLFPQNGSNKYLAYGATVRNDIMLVKKLAQVCGKKRRILGLSELVEKREHKTGNQLYDFNKRSSVS